MNRDWRLAEQAARRAAPALIMFALVILNAAPWAPSAFSPALPLLALAGVFHWALNRPGLFPSWAVFLTGVLQDTLSGAPLGLYTLVFLGVYGGAASQRRFFAGKTFFVVWTGFAATAALAMLSAWLAAAALYARIIDPAPVLFQFLLTVGVYPCIAWALLRFQNAVLPAEE